MQKIIETIFGLVILIIFTTQVFPVLFKVTDTNIILQILIYGAVIFGVIMAIAGIVGGKR